MQIFLFAGLKTGNLELPLGAFILWTKLAEGFSSACTEFREDYLSAQPGLQVPIPL